MIEEEKNLQHIYGWIFVHG